MGKSGAYNLGFTSSKEDIKTNHKNGVVNPNTSTINNNKDIEDEIVSDFDDGPKRAQWGNGLEFLMSCISLSVGLGNIWRFPFTAYENGGGAFLIPYIIVLLLIGKPIYFFEMLLGQFTSKGSVKASSVIPVLKGVAIGQQIAVACILSYYTSLIALTLFYMIKSFYPILPWSYCHDEWNDGSVNCIPADPKFNTSIFGANLTQSSSELYFIREVIKQKDQIDDGLGVPDWQLTLWLLAAWSVVFLVIIKGVKSSGKVSYFLALFPYCVLITLLIRALTLEGAWDGIKFFITPDFSQLLNPQVWYFATTQLFFSLSVGQGTIIMFSSFNRFDHNIYRDAFIVTTMDTFTSLLGGFTIFGILGNLAYNTNSEVSQVIKSGGSGLAFISYPEAIAKFKVVPQLFAVLFFFMLFTLGVGSAVGLQSAIVSNLRDSLPKIKQWAMAGVTCVIGFLVGLIYVTPGGQWILNLVDNYGGTFLIFALAILQLCGVMWVYGLEEFCWDIEYMLKWKATLFWRFSWAIITPMLMVIIFVYTMAQLEEPTYMNKNYPTQYYIIGWLLFAIGASQILLWSVWDMIRNENKKNTFKELFQQNLVWGPKSPTVFKEWKQFKEEKRANKKLQSEGHSTLQRLLWTLLGKYD